MSKIDDELTRVIMYAKSLGIKVRIANYSWNDAAVWASEPILEININKRKHTSKTELILTILHETAHNMHFAYTKEPVPINYDKENMSKRDRKKIYDYEAAGIKYMENIAIELNLSIPIWKVRKAMEIDLWQYEFFWQHARYPNKLEKRQKNKDLTTKYKEIK